MIRSPRWTVLSFALAAAAAACGGGGGGGSGADGCAWFTGANCWKTAAAAAVACTNGAATGQFDGPATASCGYAGGVSVQFDPSYPATASYWQEDVPWDFTVLTSTAAPCARYWEDATSMNLTVAGLGTVSESWASGSLVISCPGGSGGITLDVQAAMNSVSSCLDAMPGWYTSGPFPYASPGPITFGLRGMSGADTVLWRCQ